MLVTTFKNCIYNQLCKYRIAQNVGGVKLWRIDRFKSFGEENVGEFTIATISYYSESGIWLGKILVNDDCFAKFAKVLRYTVLCIIIIIIIN